MRNSQLNLPDFDNITIESLPSQIESILQKNLDTLEKLLKIDNKQWDNFIEPFEELDNGLSNFWSPIRHINSVKSSNELREIYQQCIEKITDYNTALGQNELLYSSYKTIKNDSNFAEYQSPKIKTINDALIHFELNGIALDKSGKENYKKIQSSLSKLTTQFENNLLDSTQAFEEIIVDKQILTGIPDYALDMFSQSAKSKDIEGYRITLDMPHYIAVMTYADNRDLREKCYRAYTTRASEISNKDWDNSTLMVEILKLRQEKAQLLGFKNYAEYSLKTKMAEDTQQVEKFLLDLAHKARQSAEQDYAEILEYGKQKGLEEVFAWDISWLSEQIKQQKYSISNKEIKPYLPENQVINGLFKITQNVFGITIKPSSNKVSTWHPDVKFFDVIENEEVIAHFYLDLYARENKRGGAWMDECTNRFVGNNINQIPVAYLTCNLTPPVGEHPALFTHDEVITLFHEFGHGIHHMLTKIDEPAVSGINGVEWDAVELPSQFMENWCWNKESLKLMTQHYQTAEPMPDELIDKMLKARNFQSALQLLRQVEFSLFDMQLHQKSIDSPEQIQHLLDQVRDEVSVIKPPEFNRFQNSFSHIFAGGYAAGYYSYKWAEVLSADAFSAFEDEGLFNETTGERYKQCILQKGGSRPALESFQCFMGREPEISALLRHNGIQ